MAIDIRAYESEHEAGVQAFNERLRGGQPDDNLVFYSRSVPRWLPRNSDCGVGNEYFVALEGDLVRGGYALKWQNFLFPDGQIRSIGCYHHPLSEGILDRAYASVGVRLLRDAIDRCPLLYCLGMGGYDHPLPKMLIGLGWSHFPVPFHFRIVRPFHFLRKMQALRTTPWRKLSMDLAAFSGAGWAAWRIWRAARAASRTGAAAAAVPEFSEWADALWRESATAYALTAVRDCSTLRMLYPPSVGNLVRLRIAQDGRDVGWAVVGQRRKDPKYGGMRVGSIVDCWALPGRELPVVQAATRALEERGMDLVVTNQSHPRWTRAVVAAGFFAGPSNFIFAASRPLSELLAPFETSKEGMHLTRADGDCLPDNF